MIRLRGRLGEEYQIVGSSDLADTESHLEFRDEVFAYGFLTSLAVDPFNVAALRTFTEGFGLGAALSNFGDADLFRFLALRLVSGRIRIVDFGQTRGVVFGGRRGGSGAAEHQTVQEEQPAPPPTDEKTWIKFQVLDDETGLPVEGVVLAVKLPDGTTKKSRTDGSGMIEITGIPPGTCDIESMIDSDALEVISMA